MPSNAPVTTNSHLLVKPLVRLRITSPSRADRMATSRSSQRVVSTAISSPDGERAGETVMSPRSLFLAVLISRP